MINILKGAWPKSGLSDPLIQHGKKNRVGYKMRGGKVCVCVCSQWRK